MIDVCEFKLLLSLTCGSSTFCAFVFAAPEAVTGAFRFESPFVSIFISTDIVVFEF